MVIYHDILVNLSMPMLIGSLFPRKKKDGDFLSVSIVHINVGFRLRYKCSALLLQFGNVMFRETNPSFSNPGGSTIWQPGDEGGACIERNIIDLTTLNTTQQTLRQVTIRMKRVEVWNKTTVDVVIKRKEKLNIL
ncbi:hypothetical protein SNK03_011476 [Fusarium graminearum]|uniref:Chromosome 3, complete genome n=1 Tax=Gibberella zeae (strain ATCC MYA-4620 / CBS 123657 / FGSC 9075 / NRRL 31084 / PH-1) TaxID=229533 RepID=I1S7C8_GIBZE|nr:hypothetical protein FGSG_12751 [Fusarium graminearum PH-1]ESU11477.1 hypothetical protein FGSG_12751 [Fusarium graminearum PH-1]CEF86774.1 unnamed protein product [Fusarium graminearum]CZS84148.1 unnamed protein product [Fusarium graminearum]|eukprot:XP_011324053.1 hypothetical protein FGSG_12751 [Fusarium graminearum PH-1]